MCVVALQSHLTALTQSLSEVYSFSNYRLSSNRLYRLSQARHSWQHFLFCKRKCLLYAGPAHPTFCTNYISQADYETYARIYLSTETVITHIFVPKWRKRERRNLILLKWVAVKMSSPFWHTIGSASGQHLENRSTTYVLLYSVTLYFWSMKNIIIYNRHHVSL